MGGECMINCQKKMDYPLRTVLGISVSLHSPQSVRLTHHLSSLEERCSESRDLKGLSLSLQRMPLLSRALPQLHDQPAHCHFRSLEETP